MKVASSPKLSLLTGKFSTRKCSAQECLQSHQLKQALLSSAATRAYHHSGKCCFQNSQRASANSRLETEVFFNSAKDRSFGNSWRIRADNAKESRETNLPTSTLEVKNPASDGDLGEVEFEQSKSNTGVAIASALAAVGLFAITRFAGGGIDLSTLSASSIPYDIAMSNGKPTVIEFYADWCEVCKELAKEVYNVEEKYKDDVNFVMLNIDNVKWAEELNEFGVDGIPQFTFLDAQGNEEGTIVGRLPQKYLAENVIALAQGKPAIPYTNEIGEFSSANDRTPPKQVEPRSHGI